MSALDGLRVAVETALPGVEVIHTHQVESAPRPIPLPYATVQLFDAQQSSSTPFKIQSNTASGSNFENKLSAVFESRGIVDFYGPDPVAQLQLLLLRLSRADVKTAMSDNAVVISKLGPVLRVPQERGVNMEPHAQIDLRVRHVITDTQALETIDSTEVTLDVKDTSDTTLETVVITNP